MLWSRHEVLAALGRDSAPSALHDDSKFEFISTDTRKIAPGALFVPLVGENHDAHDFVADALARGASASLWGRTGELPNGIDENRVIRSGDTLEALQSLGRYNLKRVGCRVVAITGSTGKTTTKDLVSTVLGAGYKVYKTPGNYNNDVGVALCLLELERDHQVAVLELAMRGLGQIRRLAELLDPEIGLITNIGHSHLEFLGSQRNIAIAKGELFESMSPASKGIVPFDSEFYSMLSQKLKGAQVSFSGRPESQADFRPSWLENLGLRGWKVESPGSGAHRWHLPLPGQHHLEDFIAAWAVGQHFGIDPAAAQAALDTVELSSLRLEIETRPDGTTLLNDSYNAAPDSMKAALRVLSYANGRKVAILGDMLELGSDELAFHEDVGRFAATMGLQALVTVGPRSQTLARAAREGGLHDVFSFDEVGQARARLADLVIPGDTVLLKASRSMHLDTLAPEIGK